ncbi:MAG: DUF1918 domain-containing protein [Nocardioides sp.]|nr:DUF1918 domain-containing protein [Nocardioides sp.]
MFARAGDRLIVRSNHLNGPTKEGEILEVRHDDGSPPYVVRWSDTGQESFVFPGTDALVQSPGQGGRTGGET